MKWDATLYDDQHGFVTGYGSSLLDVLDPKKGERIVDLGCGTGDLSYEISRRGAEMMGLDGSRDMIQAAKKKYPKLNFVCLDVYDWNPEPEYDAVFSNAALHWMREPDRVLKRIFQALKPNGRLIAELGMKGNIALICEALEQEWLERCAPRPLPESPWYFPDFAAYAAELQTAGFRISWMQAFDRPTRLEDPGQGIVRWLEMFAPMYLADLDSGTSEALKQGVQQRLKSRLFQDGSWFADYRRLRLEARRPAE